MQFFLYEIVARIVAIYLCVDCYREIRNGLVERKIVYMNSGDFLGWIFDWSRWVADRDATPVRYWMQIGFQTTSLLACLGVAILGWWHPDA